MIMVFLTVLMYGLSTTHIALSLRQTLIAFFNQHAADGGDTILNDPGNPITYSSIAIEVVNVSFHVSFLRFVHGGKAFSV